jgi:hypothetical protein
MTAAGLSKAPYSSFLLVHTAAAALPLQELAASTAPTPSGISESPLSRRPHVTAAALGAQLARVVEEAAGPDLTDTFLQVGAAPCHCDCHLA